MGLTKETGGGPVGLETVVFIYFIRTLPPVSGLKSLQLRDYLPTR